MASLTSDKRLLSVVSTPSHPSSSEPRLKGFTCFFRPQSSLIVSAVAVTVSTQAGLHVYCLQRQNSTIRRSFGKASQAFCKTWTAIPAGVICTSFQMLLIFFSTVSILFKIIAWNRSCVFNAPGTLISYGIFAFLTVVVHDEQNMRTVLQVCRKVPSAKAVKEGAVYPALVFYKRNDGHESSEDLEYWLSPNLA